ncbi:MAG: efflux RND transporter periplasmic adaptor subunit [Akkermansiaceae bacterium]|nr:efflux RND transporter periplasmic adaptor subunit [Akkermansiaceae bacterium]
MKFPNTLLHTLKRPKFIIPVAVLAAGTGIWSVVPRKQSHEAAAASFYKAERGSFTISLPTGGALEAVDRVTVRNLVPGRTEIISLIKEGTVVKKGDLLIELDANGIEDQLSLAEIAYQQAVFAFSEQEERVEVLKSDNTLKLRDAELAVKLATQDKTKYVDGDWPQLSKKAETTISLATEELRRAQDRLAGTKKLEAKGYVNPTELVTDTLAAKRREIELATAVEDRRLLLEFDYPRAMQQLNLALENANIKLERTRKQNQLQVEKAELQLTSSKETLDLRKVKLEELRSSKEYTMIRAPKSGLVVYEKSEDFRSEAIGEGILVRERQPLISLPDVSRMKVMINVYENQVSLVKPGMRAFINLDALPDQRFLGEVTSVASMPEPSRDGNPNFRIYKAEVLVKDQLPDIKPGITARVDVLIAELQDVIKVPLQAVVGVGDRQICFLQKNGKLNPVPVEIGLFDNDFVQITRGLESGDLVSLAPPRTTELPEKKAEEAKPEEEAPVSPKNPKNLPPGPVQKNTLAEARNAVKPG